jgi:hypothetical protein
MKQAKANYPGQEISKETAKIWLDAWYAMVLDYNLDQFMRALKRCFREVLFFPSPAAIEERLKEIKQEDAEKKPRKSKYCGKCVRGVVRLGSGEVIACGCVCQTCDGLGVVFVERCVDGYTGMQKFAKPCQCRKSA